jgi:hypothetical protein
MYGKKTAATLSFNEVWVKEPVCHDPIEIDTLDYYEGCVNT